MQNIKTILLVANANSTFTKGFINYVLDTKYDSDITLITERNDLFIDFYDEHNINVVAIRKKNIIEKIPVIRTVNYLFQVALLIKKSKADLLLIHYAWHYLLWIISFIRISPKLVITYWGSDLFRASHKQLMLAKKTVEKADGIIVLTEEMKSMFCEKYENIPPEKVNIIDFGVSAFDTIDNLENEGFEKRDVLGNNYVSNQVVITIGYNARKEQQHQFIIEALSKLEKKYLNRLFFVLPMTYPSGNDNYIQDMEEVLRKYNLSYAIITDYMNEEMISKLCLSTDIFVHAQTTDSLSTSMIEQLYSGSMVINGSWLHYKFLEDLFVEYESFSSEDDLCRLVSLILEKNSLVNTNNKAKLKDKCGWDQCANKWARLIEKI